MTPQFPPFSLRHLAKIAFLSLVLGSPPVWSQEARGGEEEPLPPGAIRRLGTARWRQGGLVTAVAISPDGRTAISGSTNTNLTLWDLVSGKQIKVLTGHSAELCSVRLSPDGKRAVSSGHDGKLIYWDLVAGAALRTFEADDSLHGLSLSPDGSQAVVGSGNEIILWDVNTGLVIRKLEGHTDLVGTMAYLPDGKRIVSGSYDKTVRIWDVETGRQLLLLGSHQGQVWTVSSSPNGKLVASGGEDMRLVLWDAASGEKVRTIGPVAGNLFYSSFSPDSKFLLADAASPGAGLWEVATGKKICEFPGHRAPVTSAAFTPDATKVLTGSRDRTLALWDVATHARLTPSEGHSCEISSVAFSPIGDTILTQSDDAALIAWDPHTGKALRRTNLPIGYSGGASLSPDGRMAISGGRGFIDVWDVSTMERKPGYSDPGFVVNAVAISPDGRTVLTASGNQIGWREFDGGTVLQTLEGHEQLVHSVAFSPDGKRAVSTSEDGTLGVWNLETGKRLQTLAIPDGPAESVAVSPNGRYALAGGKSGVVTLWDLETGRLVRQFEGHRDVAISVAFSPDGQTAVSGSWDKSVILWDVRSGKAIRTCLGHLGSVTCVAFSAGGLWFASGSTDTTVILWKADGDPSPKDASWSKHWNTLGVEQRRASLGELLEDLASIDVLRCSSARSRIDSLGDSAVDFLLEALTARMRSAAEPAELEKLLVGLDHDDPDERKRARDQLRSKGAAIAPWIEQQLRLGLSLSTEVRSSLGILREEMGRDPAAMGDLARLRIVLMLLDRLPAPSARRALKKVSELPNLGMPAELARRRLLAYENPTAAAEGRLRFAEEAKAREDFETAEASASEAEALARSAGAKALVARAASLRAEASELRSKLEAAVAARSALSRNPSDPSANRVLGNYLCIVKGNWLQGAQMLSRVDSSEVQLAAQAELAKPSGAANMAKAGDLWWEAAQKESQLQIAQGYRRRAGYWYRQAEPGLEGVDRKKAADRLKEVTRDSSVDLLKMIDLSLDTVQGKWGWNDGALALLKQAYPARIQIAYSPPEEYDLTLVAERTQGKESINLGVFGGGRQFQIVIDGWPTSGFVSSLWSLDGTDGTDNESTHQGMVLENNRPATIICSIRKTGVKVTVDDKVVINWKGSYERLTCPDLGKIPDPRAMSIGCYDVIYKFSKLTLTPISGSGKILR
jgi:WD40 repeat protein